MVLVKNISRPKAGPQLHGLGPCHDLCSKGIQGTNLHPTIINQDGARGCNISLHYRRIVSLQIKVYEDK